MADVCPFIIFPRVCGYLADIFIIPFCIIVVAHYSFPLTRRHLCTFVLTINTTSSFSTLSPSPKKSTKSVSLLDTRRHLKNPHNTYFLQHLKSQSPNTDTHRHYHSLRSYKGVTSTAQTEHFFAQSDPPPNTFTETLCSAKNPHFFKHLTEYTVYFEIYC